MDLIAPCLEYKDEFLNFLEDIQQEGLLKHLDLSWMGEHFEAYLQSVEDEQNPETVRPGRVPMTLFWMVDQGQVVGSISFRHELNDFLKEFGGHIGYEVARNHRGKGYGTLALQKVLEHARARGYERVMLTCDDSNLASSRVMEKNGGVLDRVYTVDHHPVPIRRYWIEL
ncbi:GNAT family N-acetyltransferase [Deinococcus cellulosilyticus]|uniref:N-acetyltransferase domain-containing protein n=1 Tax=Deinococcus cellulosilyticus (strain DSM 18568 / NBRC 106333 / KACC 11606 / 5516J-15) TaxID=1223518 RepID=A0A511MXB4_DEIC1|nr:GNAT family N-acetyltransferase [Deinococcus cellulosilyticus]GEM45224.1 hypothetical protein DC3_08590 [Deinococcus cellulosilyticus NBRC 106333 = KACC 11606]